MFTQTRLEVIGGPISGVEESAVIGLPHPNFGDAVIVVVTKSETCTTQKTILLAIANKLAKFKLPKHIFFVTKHPRNTMGNVQKNALRETYKGYFKRNSA